MKTLYLDLSMGAAGDMLTAALLELCPDREEMLQKLNGLAIPSVRFQPEQGQKLGVPGTHMARKRGRGTIPATTPWWTSATSSRGCMPPGG